MANSEWETGYRPDEKQMETSFTHRGGLRRAAFGSRPVALCWLIVNPTKPIRPAELAAALQGAPQRGAGGENGARRGKKRKERSRARS